MNTVLFKLNTTVNSSLNIKYWVIDRDGTVADKLYFYLPSISENYSVEVIAVNGEINKHNNTEMPISTVTLVSTEEDSQGNIFRRYSLFIPSVETGIPRSRLVVNSTVTRIYLEAKNTIPRINGSADSPIPMSFNIGQFKYLTPENIYPDIYITYIDLFGNIEDLTSVIDKFYRVSLSTNHSSIKGNILSLTNINPDFKNSNISGYEDYGLVEIYLKGASNVTGDLYEFMRAFAVRNSNKRVIVMWSLGETSVNNPTGTNGPIFVVENGTFRLLET